VGAIEQEGIRRALRRAEEADLVLWIMDAMTPVADIPTDLAERGVRVLRVLNKIDASGAQRDMPSDHAISVRTGAGIPELIAALGSIVQKAAGAGDAMAITQVRHRQQIEACLDALHSVPASSAHGPELAAEQLRLSADALGRVVGRIDPEDVLDQVFARFCIGK
jgi:tRNA modification GTPase